MALRLLQRANSFLALLPSVPFARRQAPLHFHHHGLGPLQAVLRFGRVGLVRHPWVSESPGVLRQAFSLRDRRLKRVVNGKALWAQIAEIVGFSKGPVVKGQERLERLHRGLLAMKQRLRPSIARSQ